MTHYLLILEHGKTSWGAYAPDIPGCVAVADTREEVKILFQDAAQEHLDWMHKDGDLIPKPCAETETVTIALPGHALCRYLVILQPTPLGNWSVSAADVLDLVLEFSDRNKALRLFQAALQSYLEMLLANEQPLPELASEAVTVTVRLADTSIAVAA